MKAMILAAGEGTRLRPLTLETPKALVPINGTPLVDYTLSWLKSHGISEVAINLFHLGEKVKDYLGDGSRWGIRIVYSEETTLLGTAGAIKKMKAFFNGPFVVFYGDNLTDFNLTEMIRLHREKEALATIAVFEVAKPWEVGVVQLDKQARVLNLVEKPPQGASTGNLANAGVYVLEREVLDSIPAGFSDFACDVFPKLIASGAPVYGYRLKQDDYLLDIGTLEKYKQANEDARMGRAGMRGQGVKVRD